MVEKISAHRLLHMEQYSIKGLLKTIILGWVIFFVIFGATRIPELQRVIQSFAQNVQVPWVTSNVDFIINGIWIFFIPLTIGTFIQLSRKQPFEKIVIYDSGLGFVRPHSKEERYAEYKDIKLEYGMLQKSINIECKKLRITRYSYIWEDFENGAVLRANLEQYGKWEI